MIKSKLLTVCLLFVYLFISQFIVKAWVTTDRSLATSETFCMNKKLDTYESKTGCRKKNMTATFAAVLSEIPQLVIAYTTPTDFSECGNAITTSLCKERTTRPPPEYSSSSLRFVTSYVGITRLVI